MKSILVPIDFSDYADNALDFAAQLAKKTGASIQLIHVVEAPTSQTFNTMGLTDIEEMNYTFHKELIDVVNKKMDQIINRKDFQGIDMDHHVVVGKPYESISEHIASQKTDLVIMGTRGCSGLEEIIIGSIAEKVIRFATCPVITIPESQRMEDIKCLVYATDLSQTNDRIINVLKYFQKLLNAKIELLWVHTPHILESEEVIQNKLDAFVKAQDLNNCSIAIRRDITVEGGVMSFAEEINADLIVMSTHGRQGLAHIFSGSYAEDIVNHSKRPVLTVSMKAENFKL